MIIGVPKEIKNHEYRVAIVPAGVRQLIKHGHRVIVETGAGNGSGFADKDYIEEGAEIARNPLEVYDQAQMIVKVKEPLEPEFPLIKPDHIVFTYFHFASSKELTEKMMQTGAVCIAYETVETEDGHLPLCQKLLAGWQCRKEPSIWNVRLVAGEYCWVALLV